MQNNDAHRLTIKEYKGLFDRLYASLCLFSNKYVRDLEVSKDLVQDVFIKIWEDKVAFKNENNIKSYLYTSVKNKSLDYLKSKRYKSTDHFSIHEIEKTRNRTFFFKRGCYFGNF